ncbi:hypothetical protein DYB25_001255 [Aphanomyces astaci]|uniref:START domain-containing protein n=1 Tax=Aphanomyces astaci TaxID=112090 RepID=A0A397BA34_APHAT|nr:hypothetical protein DYB25_001255 [Aphanomyces astaci]
MTSTMPASPVHHTRFRLPALTSVQKEHFRRLATGLLDQAVEETELLSTTFNMDQDHNDYWKHVRSHHGLKLYKAAKPANGSPSADLMMTGIVQGSLDDVMTSVYADTTAMFQMQSALSMPKDHLDCEILHAIDTTSSTHPHHPYYFRGLKWCATNWPGRTLSKPRDFCYFEATGVSTSSITTSTTNNNNDDTTFGYCLMESFDLAHCQSLESLSIVRGKLSIRHIFKQLPIGCVLVTTHCSIDACMGGPLSSWMRDGSGSSLPHLLALSRAADIAESVRLSMKLRQHAGGCLSPSRSFAGMFHGSSSSSACSLCQRHQRTNNMARKRIVEPSYGQHIRTSKRPFCEECLRTDHHSLTRPDNVTCTTQQATQTLREGQQVNQVFPSRRHHQQHAATIAAATDLPPTKVVPMLDLDYNSHDDEFDDDDGEASVYSGIDIRSTVQSHLDIYESEDEGDDVEEAGTPIMRARRTHADRTCSQLAHLTAKMDDTLRLLRRNKTHIDFCRSHGRVEVL